MGYNYNDYDDCCKAIKENGMNLYFVPERLKIGSLCLDAIKQNAMAIRYISDITMTYEMCLEAIKQNPSVIIDISEKHKVKRICLEAVKRNGLLIKHIPEKIKTEDICLQAVLQNPKAIKYISIDKNDIYIEAIKRYGVAAIYTNKIEICLIALKIDSDIPTTYKYRTIKDQIIINIPKEKVTKKICLEALKNKPQSLINIPHKYIIEEMNL